MMKQFKLIISLLGVILIISILSLIFVIIDNRRLTKEKQDKLADISLIKESESELKKVKGEMNKLYEKQAAISQQIPQSEFTPIDLIKQLSLLANKIQIKDMELMYTDISASSAVSTLESLRMNPAGGLRENSNHSKNLQESADENIGENGHQKIETDYVLNNLSIQPIDIQMEFSAEYFQLLSFMKEILRFKRIIVIENLIIERKEQLIPRQKVSMKLSAYTFLSGK